MVVDGARHIADAPRPAVCADALRLPFRDGQFDGAAALWTLCHLADPVQGLWEAHRVLRTGGLSAVSTTSRRNVPELAAVRILLRRVSLRALPGARAMGLDRCGVRLESTGRCRTPVRTRPL